MRIFFVISFSLFGLACRSTPPSSLGITDNRLSACPDKPNCVSSMSESSEESYIEAFKKADEDYRQKLEKAISAHPRTTIKKSDENYIWAESESLIFRFVDDVEFYIPGDSEEIHVRSASRLGHSDLGVNRKRIESIREAYLAQ